MRLYFRLISDPKPCPKRASDAAYEKTPGEGSDVSRLDASLRPSLTKSHRSELNRRPLHLGKGSFSGISRLFIEITRRISAFQGRKAEKSPPESVPKVCLFVGHFRRPLTNPLSEVRFTSERQRELEKAVREEERRFAFRRHY
jgi:hypothetical protein